MEINRIFIFVNFIEIVEIETYQLIKPALYFSERGLSIKNWQ